jgi:two-component system chemotaxis response regulator CheB
MLENILARHTKLRVRAGARDELLHAATVYVAPSDRHLVVDESRLHLSAGPPVCFSRPSIDVMFRSVAASWGPRAVGVILSGSGRDGADALQAIRKAGGTVIVQDPAHAKFPDLPRRAIAAGHVHFTRVIEAIGPLLMRLVSPHAVAIVSL